MQLIVRNLVLVVTTVVTYFNCTNILLSLDCSNINTMATKFFIRVKSGIKSTIYFRYNKGREFEVTLKTPYSINPQKWDDKNECYNTSGIKKVQRLH